MTIAIHHPGLGGPAEMTDDTVHVCTVHKELSLPIRLALLDAIDRVLHDQGIERVWIDPTCASDLVVLATGLPD